MLTRPHALALVAGPLADGLTGWLLAPHWGAGVFAGLAFARYVMTR